MRRGEEEKGREERGRDLFYVDIMELFSSGFGCSLMLIGYPSICEAD